MTTEEKSFLLKDLCARLPYNVKIDYSFINDEHIRIHTVRTLTYRNFQDICIDEWHTNEEIYKPYLRPMSSMTEEEKDEYDNICGFYGIHECEHVIDWLNKKGFDYRGLIPMGLALEAPEGMYKHE